MLSLEILWPILWGSSTVSSSSLISLPLHPFGNYPNSFTYFFLFQIITVRRFGLFSFGAGNGSVVALFFKSNYKTSIFCYFPTLYRRLSQYMTTDCPRLFFIQQFWLIPQNQIVITPRITHNIGGSPKIMGDWANFLVVNLVWISRTQTARIGLQIEPGGSDSSVPC